MASTLTPKGLTQTMMLRDIIEIDETKCDGCGLCVPACEEGAIQIIGGKARVVSDSYCDGLGACLGHCPRGAISNVQRAAAPFDHQAVTEHLAAGQRNRAPQQAPAAPPMQCPGTAPRQLPVFATAPAAPCAGGARSPAIAAAPAPSRLANWPVQLHLLPPTAPFLRDADLLLVADCVPVACADFHARFLDGRPVAVGCPKLDDVQAYVHKLAAIDQIAHLRSITVVHMDVPCCLGMLRVARAAVQRAGIEVPVEGICVERH